MTNAQPLCKLSLGRDIETFDERGGHPRSDLDKLDLYVPQISLASIQAEKFRRFGEGAYIIWYLRLREELFRAER
jgi:hypothetical protein